MINISSYETFQSMVNSLQYKHNPMDGELLWSIRDHHMFDYLMKSLQQHKLYAIHFRSKQLQPSRSWIMECEPDTIWKATEIMQKTGQFVRLAAGLQHDRQSYSQMARPGPPGSALTSGHPSPSMRFLALPRSALTLRVKMTGRNEFWHFDVLSMIHSTRPLFKSVSPGLPIVVAPSNLRPPQAAEM